MALGMVKIRTVEGFRWSKKGVVREYMAVIAGERYRISGTRRTKNPESNKQVGG